MIRECYVYNITGKSILEGYGNTYTPPGIFLFRSENGTITKNKIYSSIVLLGSTHNVITKNTIRSVNNSSFDGHGISLGHSPIDYRQNSGNNDIMNNTIYNKTIGIMHVGTGVIGGEECTPLDNNIENNTFINVEEEFEKAVATEDGGNNDSWFQTRSFYYSVILLGISLVILGAGWRRVKKEEEKDER